MKYKIFVILLLGFVYAGCSNHDSGKHDESKDGEVHEHEDEGSHQHEKVLLTAYNSSFELFAESDPFIVGEENSVLSHLTHLSNFKPLDSATVLLRFETDQTELAEGQQIKPGIYNFKIKPIKAGKTILNYEISQSGQKSVIQVPAVVYNSDEEADADDSDHIENVNSVVFTKEQSWRIDFATELPKMEEFGQVIRTIGQVMPSQTDEILLSAKTSGIVSFRSRNLLQGQRVTTGESLLEIIGSGMAQGNSSVQFNEARNNYENAKSTYERQKELAKDRIISERELQSSKLEYENAKTIYDNLSENFNASGQNLKSPISGFIATVYKNNGEYVEAGQPVLSVIKNQDLIIRAELQQKYMPFVNSINDASIKKGQKVFSLKELNGKILAIGKSLSAGNFMIPVTLKIESNGLFMPGELVEVNLKSKGGAKSLTIPNSALLEEQGLYFVFVQRTPELFEKREVRIGSGDGIRSVVTEGITANERIVTKGAMMVKLSQSSGALDPHAGHVH